MPPLKWTGPAFLLFVSKQLLAPRIEKCGAIVRDEARALTQKPKTGTAQVTQGGVHYRSSAPGEPFASPTHVGEKSIDSEFGFEGKEPATRIGTNNKNIARHILGLNKDEAPRDPLVPAMMNTRGECISALKGG